MDLEDTGQLATVRFVIRDRDAKYPAPMDQSPQSAGIATVLTGVQVPRMNALMKPWGRTPRADLAVSHAVTVARLQPMSDREKDAEISAVGFNADPNQTLADYLTGWLEAKELRLKPTTFARYRDYIRNDLIPALGDVLPDVLGCVHAQLERGTGKVTVHQILATLSGALGDAVRRHRLARNPARPTVIPRPAAAERRIWASDEAARFLRCCRLLDPVLADLVEVIIGTGLRKGEALGLH